MSGHIRNEDVLDSTLKKGKMDFTEIGNDKVLILNHTGQLTSATLSGLSLNTSGVLSVDSTTPYISSVSDPLHVTTGNLTIDGETVEEAVAPLFISAGTLTLDLHGNMTILGGSQLAADIPTSTKFLGSDGSNNFVSSTIGFSDLPTSGGSDGDVLTLSSGVPAWVTPTGGGGGDFLADGSVPMTGILYSKNIDLDGNLLPHVDNASSLGNSSFYYANGYITHIECGNIVATTLYGSSLVLTDVLITCGGIFTGSPEGHLTANPGSLYLSPDNGNLYFKVSGTADTGWKAVLLAP